MPKETGSFLDLARTGKLSPIHLGTSRAEGEQCLGRAPSWALADHADVATIWRYGDIELYFDDEDRVYMLFSDHNDLCDGGATWNIEPWIIRAGLSQDAFETELKSRKIGYRSVRPAYDPDQVVLITTAGAVYAFGHPNQPSYGRGSGLLSWHMSSCLHLHLEER